MGFGEETAGVELFEGEELKPGAEGKFGDGVLEVGAPEVEPEPLAELDEEIAEPALDLDEELTFGAGTVGAQELTYLVCASVMTVLEETVLV